MLINKRYLICTLVIISCIEMNPVQSDFASDLAALIKKQNEEIMKRNLAQIFSGGDGVSAWSTPDGNVVSTTQDGKKTTVGSKGPVAGAYGNAVAAASDGSGTVVATGR